MQNDELFFFSSRPSRVNSASSLRDRKSLLKNTTGSHFIQHRNEDQFHGFNTHKPQILHVARPSTQTSTRLFLWLLISVLSISSLLLFPFLTGLTTHIPPSWFTLLSTHLHHAQSYVFTTSPGTTSLHQDQGIVALEERVRILESKFFHYSRDGVARQDFASRFAGARVVDDLTTPTPPDFNSPYVALEGDLRAGRCWRILQTSAQLGVKLAQQIEVTHLSIDHIPGELVMNLTHAPRDIILWGVTDTMLFPLLQYVEDPIWLSISRRTPALTKDGQIVVPLAVIQYNISSSDIIQTFPVPDSIFANGTFSLFIVDILNNWGAEWTCLYRVRIHGKAMV